jgi:hypothetical protein
MLACPIGKAFRSQEIAHECIKLTRIGTDKAGYWHDRPFTRYSPSVEAANSAAFDDIALNMRTF